MDHTITVYIHFWDELSATVNSWPSGSDEWHWAHDRAYKVIGDLRHVDEICFSHQCWVRLSPAAKTWRGIDAEVARTKAKISSILNRLKRPEPTMIVEK